MRVKIAHIADIHQGLGYPGPDEGSRFRDIDESMKQAAMAMVYEGCKYAVITGDLFRSSQVYLNRAQKEISNVANWLKWISQQGIECFVISGTPSHDAIAAYDLLADMDIPDVKVITTPTVEKLWLPNEETIHLACIPGLNRNAFVTNEQAQKMSVQMIHLAMTNSLKSLALGLYAEGDEGETSILLSHLTYSEADTGFQQILQEHEPILNAEAVAPFDQVYLGHIHKAQSIRDKVFYPGTIQRLSFNEEGYETGFWIHEYDSDTKTFEHAYQEIHSREFISLNWGEAEVAQFAEGQDPTPPTLDLRHAIVRLSYSCPESLAAMVSRKDLQEYFTSRGVFYLASVSADIKRENRTRDNEVTESISPVQAIPKWAATRGIEDPDQISDLQDKAREILPSVGYSV